MPNQTEVATLRPLQYPSEEFPEIPSFEIGVPVGWELDDHTGRLLVMSDPASPPEFVVNLMLGADRLPAGLTLEQLAPELPTVANQPRIATIGGVPAAAWLQGIAVDGQVVELAQLQVVFFGPQTAGPTKHLFSLHATCPVVEVDTYLPVFTDVARSFRFLRAGTSR